MGIGLFIVVEGVVEGVVVVGEILRGEEVR